MLAKIRSGTTMGLQGILVEIEVDVSGRGFPTFTIVGLPNKAVDEAKDRVRTALVNTGYEMPDSRVTVNLAPADVPKTGSAFDLGIALGLLMAQSWVKVDNTDQTMFIGELSLEGAVRRVQGIVPLLLLAQEKQIKTVYIPADHAEEAALIPDISVIPVKTLREVISHLSGEKIIVSVHTTEVAKSKPDTVAITDFAHIRGQEQAKRALEIAAAGFHNVHLKGSPGAGKTLLSRSFPGILPLLTKEEILEVAKIYSVVGELQPAIFQGKRPFRAPHHTTSRNGLIGGGSTPMPGEISLAHRGVLFLDEFPEFPHATLESLRQPIEDGLITISRASGSLTYPARFLLLAASNPCPCGYLGHPTRQCICAPGTIIKYQKRLSGPLLDRIDLHLDVPPVDVDKLSEVVEAESSSTVRERVLFARENQKKRFKNTRIQFNSEMTSADIRHLCVLENAAQDLLKKAINTLSLSARSYFKIIKIAQTIADLAGVSQIGSAHIAEAIQFRG